MSRLDPHNQKLEVKSLDPGCSRLNPEASRLRINDVLKSLSVNHAHPISPQANTLTMLTSVFKNCDEALLMQSLIGSSFFWSRFFALVNKYAYSNSLLYSALSVMKTTEHMLMSAKKKKATDALKTFCSGFHGHFNILSLFAAELLGSSEASRLSVEIIYVVGTYISCLNKAAKSSPEWAALIVAEFYFSLRDTGFFSSLSYHMEENADSKIHDAVVNLFFTPLKTTLLFMATTKVSDDMIKLSKQFESAVDGAFGMNNSTKELFVKANEEYEDPSRFSILQIVDVISILKDDNTSLKKMILEQLMFEKRPLPLLSGCMGISDMLFEHCKKGCNGLDTPLYIIQLVFNRDQVTAKLVHKLARFWNESNSKGPDDLASLLELLKNLLEKVDQNVSKCPQDNIVLERVMDVITTTPYEKLRQVQLQQQKGKQYQKWNQHAPHFNSMLSQQVEDYIRQQRLFQLQIGTWVYSDDPTVHHAKHPKLYYLVLSDNHNNLLAREFKYRIEKIPTVEQNRIITSDSNAVIGSTTTVIPLKRITDFHSRELKLHKVMPNHKKLINVSRRTTYTEVQLIGKGQKCLLMFYLDNKETSYIWFDGLQLIASQKPKVSKTTKSQIDTLIDIRKNIQMVGLSDYRFVEGFEDYSDDDHYYDLDTLSTLTDDFYYD